MKKYLSLVAVLSLTMVGCAPVQESKVGNATDSSMKDAAADVNAAVKDAASDVSKAAAEAAKDVADAAKDAATGVADAVKDAATDASKPK